MKTLRIALATALAVASLSAQAVGHLADVTVFDRSTGRELPVYWHEGRAYVVGRPGNEYQVGVRNKWALTWVQYRENPVKLPPLTSYKA